MSYCIDAMEEFYQSKNNWDSVDNKTFYNGEEVVGINSVGSIRCCQYVSGGTFLDLSGMPFYPLEFHPLPEQRKQ